jgi:two-component system response regulator VanR
VPTASRPSLLVVDDHEEICELLAAFLRDEGYETTVAFDGREAMRLLGTTRFDFGIFDLLLPEGPGGVELARFAESRGTGVLIISGAVDARDLVRGLPFTFLAKPFRLTDLLALVRAAV